MSIYTSGEYLAHNPTWHAEDSPWKARQIISLLRANHLTPDSVCEVGCGAGEIIRCMASDSPNSDFVGYDISPQAISRAQDKAGANLSYIEGDALASGTHYDLAMAIDVLEHVDDYIGFARKVKTLADYKIYHIPLDMSVQVLLRVRKLKDLREEIGHLHYFSRETALATLAYTEHQIIDCRYTPGAIELAPKSILQQVANILRRILFPLAPHLTVRLLGGFSLLVLCK